MSTLDIAPLEGGFNSNVFVHTERGHLALARTPRHNADLWENIVYEYRELGFTAAGGRVRRRTPEEQFDFSQKAARAGLLALSPIATHRGRVIYPFIERAQTLDEYLTAATTGLGAAQHLVGRLFADLRNAHSQGYLYGDRWAGNMLVRPDRPVGQRLVHIDFDLELSGKTARELEIAQVAYHSLWAGGNRLLPTLAYHLTQDPSWVNLPVTAKYMRGFARFLADTPVGGMEETTDELIDTARAIDPTRPMPGLARAVLLPRRPVESDIRTFGPTTIHYGRLERIRSIFSNTPAMRGFDTDG